MLAKLGAYLRIVGLDAAPPSPEPTLDRLRRAQREGRVFLTRNRRLVHQGPLGARAYQVSATDPVRQLHQVLEAFGIDPTERLFTRCIRCNVELEPARNPEEVEDRVPPLVRGRYTRFWTCSSCGTVFWRGSHVRNTCRKLGLPLPESG